MGMMERLRLVPRRSVRAPIPVDTTGQELETVSDRARHRAHVVVEETRALVDQMRNMPLNPIEEAIFPDDPPVRRERDRRAGKRIRRRRSGGMWHGREKV